MTFAAFTSALIVRQGAAPDWQHFTLPPILYLNSLIIIASSVTLEISRRQIATFMVSSKSASSNTEGTAPARWLYVTLFLGLLFVAGQTFAWLQLKSQGFGLATNVSYSFFYVLTVAHAVHLLGGLGGLVRVISRLNHSVLKRSTLNATALYWHFMGALWLYLLLLLWMKLWNDDALTQSKVGGNVSQADLSIHGQVSRTSATEIMTAPAFAVPAKKSNT